MTDEPHACAGFSAANMALLAASGAAAAAGPLYYAGVAAGGAHLAWQVARVDLNNGNDCMAKFVSNKWFGGVVFAGIVADKLSGG